MDVGTGIAVAFGTSGFTAELLAVNGNDISRTDIDVTHMGSATYMEFQPSKLLNGGSVDIELGFDPDAQPPIDQPPETITITFPLPSGGISPATLVFTGYVNTWSFAVPLEDKMTATATIKIDGKTAPVWTAST